MPSVEDRYGAAVAYVRRAIATVESRGVAYAVDPITGLVEWYAGRTKTAPVRSELERIEARWLRATNDIDRARIARDAEELADRVQEALPGAPQDRQRTNLYEGEVQKSTPATSYYDELDSQVRDVFHAAGDASSNALATVGKVLLVGGTVFLGLKLANFVRDHARRSETRAAGNVEQQLNANLARAATHRDARGPKNYSLRLSRAELEALYFLAGRYDSAAAVVDGLIPLDDSADAALARDYDRGEGPYRFQIAAVDVRQALRATRGDGGAYGAIPNLRSPALDWVLGEERSRER